MDSIIERRFVDRATTIEFDRRTSPIVRTTNSVLSNEKPLSSDWIDRRFVVRATTISIGLVKMSTKSLLRETSSTDERSVASRRPNFSTLVDSFLSFFFAFFQRENILSFKSTLFQLDFDKRTKDIEPEKIHGDSTLEAKENDRFHRICLVHVQQIFFSRCTERASIFFSRVRHVAFPPSDRTSRRRFDLLTDIDLVFVERSVLRQQTPDIRFERRTNDLLALFQSTDKSV